MSQSVDENVCVTFTGPRAVEARTGRVPTPSTEQVVIKTAFSGISAGTEMNVYRGVAPQWRRRYDPRSGLFTGDVPEWTYPLVYGYANVGVIEECGSAVTGVGAGDVVFSYTPHCAYVVADASAVVALPALPDLRRGVFLANLNTALNGVLDAHPVLGDCVVVSGLGVIGLLVVRLLRRAGAGLIVAIDPVEHRRQHGLHAGADVVRAPGEDVAELVREETGGRGADIVVEVSGFAPALNEAIRLVGLGGRVVAMSWYGGTFESLSLAGEFHHNRVRIISSQVDAVDPGLGPLWSTERRMAVATELLAAMPLEEYITHQFMPESAALAYEFIDHLDEPVVQCIFAYGKQ